MPPSRPTDPADATSFAAHGLDPSDALSLLQLQPGAVGLADARGIVVWCNPAMRSLFASGEPPVGRPLAELLASSGADAAEVQRVFDEQAMAALPSRVTLGDGRAFEMHLCGRLDTRWVVSLCPAASAPQAADAAQDAAGRLSELREMVQEFGQLGVWERNVRTLQGRWSRKAHALRGTPPLDGTPDFDASMRTIVEDDRARVERAVRQSMRAAGRYALRYRVRGADGAVRHLHSQWQVVNGADGRPDRAIGVLRDDTEHWQLARSHGETLEHLNLAVELAQIAVWRRDLLTHQVQMNEMGFRLLDLPRDQGMNVERLRALIHPDDQAQAQADIERAIGSGEPVDSELRVRDAAGRWRYFLTRRMVQRDGQGRPLAVFAVALDMSERLAGSRQRIEMLRQFEITAGVAGIGYWTMDTATGIVRWSDQVYVMHGLPVRSPLPDFDTWAARYVHEDDRADVVSRFSAWADGAVLALDIGFRIVRGDGAVRHLESHVRSGGLQGHTTIFGVLLDVTERHHAEAALRAAGERSALVTRGVGLGTWQMDPDTGKAIWDEQMWRLRGLPAQAEAPDVEQRLALVHPEDREAVRRQLMLQVQPGQMTTQEFRVRLPDGQWRWLASRSMTVHDKASGRNQRIGVNWDITDARMAHLARQERAAVLLESQAKSQFLSRMSHELRTPLNAVLGFTQLLLADGERASVATRKRRLEQIQAAGRHLLALIDDVLDLSSLEGGELRVAAEPVPLTPLVAETMALVARQARQMKLKLRHTGEEVVALADATRLRQVLLNLLTNAVKYNVEGGSVTVHTATETTGVVLIVSDTGLGMSEAQLAHAFEPFNRLGLERGAIEGTGIGLSIVRTLVERMRGEVWVRSTPGEGSVFEVRLPAASSLPAAPARPDERAAPPPAPPAPTHRARLLYIEDNAVNQLIVQELVALRPDLSLVCADCGAAGIEQALLQPDLILIDMQLPDFDGYEVLRRLRSNPATAHIRCIAVSADALPDDVVQARQAGFADYWTKPLDFKVFLASLEDHFGAPR